MVTIEEYSDEDAATNCNQYGSFEFLQEVLSDQFHNVAVWILVLWQTIEIRTKEQAKHQLFLHQKYSNDDIKHNALKGLLTTILLLKNHTPTSQLHYTIFLIPYVTEPQLP